MAITNTIAVSCRYRLRPLALPVLRAAMCAALLLLAAAPLQAGRRHTFAISGGQFLYDGKPLTIRSGEMHYERVPQAYWRHRLRMLKAMGMNTVATYIFWNWHEPEPGVWDWSSERHDLRRFILTAQEEGLHVILRPGPYSCGEWEFGGYPWWLLTVPGMHIRSSYGPFAEACRSYIQQLAAQVRDLQVTHGGPVIMVQAENEYGWYVEQCGNISTAEQTRYKSAIRQMLVEAGFDVPFYTADNINLMGCGAVHGALPVANGKVPTERLKAVVDSLHHGEGPYMIGESYPGWFTHWGEPHAGRSVGEVTGLLRQYLADGLSFSYYVAHGGTSFGFFAGANYSTDRNIQPDITSYDYDAPISEAGWPTPKYDSIRTLIQRHLGRRLPPVPRRVPDITIPEIKLRPVGTLLCWADSMRPVCADRPLTFEALHQGYGYVLYRRKFVKPHKGVLGVDGIADYGLVYVNGRRVGQLNRLVCRTQVDVDIPADGTLDILVENCGRINFGARITDNFKGITSPVTINGYPVNGSWQMYGFPMSTLPAPQVTGPCIGLPTLYEGTFTLSATGDTFVDMRGWGKGIVVVNGVNLGRYWNIGPQQTLYLPGCYLRKGTNSIAVFEQLNDSLHTSVSCIGTPLLNVLGNQ